MPAPAKPDIHVVHAPHAEAIGQRRPPPALDSHGELLWAGRLAGYATTGDIAFGQEPLTAQGYDALFMRVSAAGEVLMSRGYRQSNDQEFRSPAGLLGMLDHERLTHAQLAPPFDLLFRCTRMKGRL